MTTTGTRVRGPLFDPYATDETTRRRFDLADQISEWLDAHPGRDFTTSQIARGVHAELTDTRLCLEWLADNIMINRAGRGGAWVRYTTRRTP